MNNQQFERLVANLQDVMRCPHCSAKYSLGDVSYLGQLDGMTFLHMKCSQCHSPVFASVATTNENGELFPSDITAEDIAVTDSPAGEELAYDEELRNVGFEQRSIDIDSPETEPQDIPVEAIKAEKVLMALTPVSYDDVLDVHQYLDTFRGDFEKLMS
ncbi:MAG: hypothetical protein PHR51_01495 [Patescibacteria group bacterium]|nr:hypothetical protein [Patescibacteria group bacterium]